MTGTESVSDGSSSNEYSVDEDDQLQQADTLMDRGVDDVLDEGYSPPDHAPHGMGRDSSTDYERDGSETLDQLLSEEEPDPAMGLDDSRDEAGRGRADAAERDSEFPRDDEVGGGRSGRLLAPDEGVNPDEDSELFATDVGIDAGAASAEEAAVHVITERDF